MMELSSLTASVTLLPHQNAVAFESSVSIYVHEGIWLLLLLEYSHGSFIDLCGGVSVDFFRHGSCMVAHIFFLGT